jgi:hypothetical protein
MGMQHTIFHTYFWQCSQRPCKHYAIIVLISFAPLMPLLYATAARGFWVILPAPHTVRDKGCNALFHCAQVGPLNYGCPDKSPLQHMPLTRRVVPHCVAEDEVQVRLKGLPGRVGPSLWGQAEGRDVMSNEDLLSLPAVKQESAQAAIPGTHQLVQLISG